MIDFHLTDEQRLLEQSVREWAAREVAPRIRELDRQHRFDRERMLGGMATLGLLGISVPQRVRRRRAWTTSASASPARSSSTSTRRSASSCRCTPGCNCLTLLTWGTEDQKQRYLVPQAQGEKIASYGLTEPSRRQRRARHPDDGRQEGRPLRPHRREDVDLARRRRRPLPRLRLDRSREEEAARSVRHQRVHRRAHVQGVFERDDEGEVGHPRRQHRLLQDGRGRGARRRICSAARARGSRSRCSRSTRDASRWPPAPPA